MVQYMMDHILMEFMKAMENLHGQIVQSTSEIGKKAQKMAKEYINIQMVQYILVIGKMICITKKEY